MESNSELGRINISGATKRIVEQYFDTEARGPIEVKNKGKVEMYFTNGLKEFYSIDEKRRFPNELMKSKMGLKTDSSGVHEMI
jgi:hypothetical protein